MENMSMKKSSWLNTNASDNTLAKAVNDYSVTPSLNIYGSGKDLAGAMSKYNGMKGVNFNDTSTPGFDPSTMKGGLMLGGNGVNTNITDDMLNKSGVQRIWGQDSAGTANALNKYMDSYGKPALPAVPSIPGFGLDTSKTSGKIQHVVMPTYNSFSFNGSMQDYLDQSQNMLKPQYDLTVKNINDNYDSNIIPQANNDTLSRGLARSSYAGNRVDQINKARTDDLTNEAMQQQQQINNLALQNYNTDYDRAYQGWKDNNTNTWKQWDANMNLYNAQNDNFWRDKNWQQQQNQWNWQQTKDRNEESWRHINYDNANNQWQKQFDYTKQNADREYELEKQKLEQAAAVAAIRAYSGSSRSGSSGGGRRSSGNSSSGGGYTKSDISEQTKIKYQQMVNAGDLQSAKEFLDENADSIMQNAGTSTYKSLVSDWQRRAKAEQKLGEDY